MTTNNVLTPAQREAIINKLYGTTATAQEQALAIAIEQAAIEQDRQSRGEPINLCDCERGYNGMGMAGKECDCPAGNKAQPAEPVNETIVPDEVWGLRYHSESIRGWNSCRHAMIQTTPPAAALSQQTNTCAGCGKKASEGWALYCVGCVESINAEPGRDAVKAAGTLIGEDTKAAARDLFERMACIADDEKCIEMLAAALATAQPDPAMAGPECIASIIRTIPTGYFNPDRRGQEANRDAVAYLVSESVQPASGEDAK